MYSQCFTARLFIYFNTISRLLDANETRYTGGHFMKVIPNWDYLSTLLWPVLTCTCFFILTLISTICNKGTWKSVHLHIVHQANKEQEPRGVGGGVVLRCTQGGANHLELFKNPNKNEAIFL